MKRCNITINDVARETCVMDISYWAFVSEAGFPIFGPAAGATVTWKKVDGSIGEIHYGGTITPEEGMIFSVIRKAKPTGDGNCLENSRG